MTYLRFSSFLLLLSSSLSMCKAFASPRVFVLSAKPFQKPDHSPPVKSFVPLQSVDAKVDSDGTQGEPIIAEEIDDDATVSLSNQEILDIMKGGTNSLKSIADSVEETGKKEDPFGVLRLGAVAILSLGGLLNLLHDASKLGASVEGGYVAGSIISLTIDTAFTLAMMGAFYKEWQQRQA